MFGGKTTKAPLEGVVKYSLAIVLTAVFIFTAGYSVLKLRETPAVTRYNVECYMGIQPVFQVLEVEEFKTEDGPVIKLLKDNVRAVYKLANGEICYWQEIKRR